MRYAQYYTAILSPYWIFMNWTVRYGRRYTLHCAKKATINQVTTKLATPKNVLLPGHNHLLTTGSGAQMIIKVSGHQHRWLAGGYDLEIGHF